MRHLRHEKRELMLFAPHEGMQGVAGGVQHATIELLEQQHVEHRLHVYVGVSMSMQVCRYIRMSLLDTCVLCAQIADNTHVYTAHTHTHTHTHLALSAHIRTRA